MSRSGKASKQEWKESRKILEAAKSTISLIRSFPVLQVLFVCVPYLWALSYIPRQNPNVTPEDTLCVPCIHTRGVQDRLPYKNGCLLDYRTTRSADAVNSDIVN